MRSAPGSRGARATADNPPVYHELLRRWAAGGFVVVAPAFPNTKFGAPDCDVLGSPNQLADMIAALDGMLARSAQDPLRQRIDPAHIVAAGHSAGAITALGQFTAEGLEGRDERFASGNIMAGNSLGVGETFTGRSAVHSCRG